MHILCNYYKVVTKKQGEMKMLNQNEREQRQSELIKTICDEIDKTSQNAIVAGLLHEEDAIIDIYEACKIGNKRSKESGQFPADYLTIQEKTIDLCMKYFKAHKEGFALSSYKPENILEPSLIFVILETNLRDYIRQTSSEHLKRLRAMEKPGEQNDKPK